ncbi:MAG: tRNA pseudouridine(38-40) synthase TruA [Alistipes sp.]|nr:tRNA pseudouridine(38-40) synthase TruA [Alistipes sp.]
MRRNYKMLLSYDGSRYYGWEHQPDTDTVQGRLEQAFFELFGEVPDINGAGRTDAGVHAKGMTANVWLDTEYTANELRNGLNKNLPEDIAVLEVRIASDKFHARYSAVGKTYRYTCHCGEYRAVFDRKYVYELDRIPDIDSMRKAAEVLTGKHDYASFCRQAAGYPSTVRVVDVIAVEEKNGYITFTFHGTGFMRNMVRILVGTLLEVGFGKISVGEVEKILYAKNREAAGYTAPACGLCLMKVDY